MGLGGTLRRSLRPVGFISAAALFFVLLFTADHARAQRGGRAPAPSQGSGRGWSNPKALELAKEAVAAKKAGDSQGCVRKDQSSLALEDHPYVRLHLSTCLIALGRYKDALVASRDALAAGIRNDDDELKRAAQARVQEILPKLAHLKLKIPKKTSGLKVMINGTPLRPHQLKERMTMDPTDYVVEAYKEEKGDRYSFRDTGTLSEGEDKVIEVLPKKDNLSPVTEECLRDAQSYEDKLKCIEEKSTRPNVHVGLELSGYTDSTNTHVLSPAINAAVDSPTAGWNVGGSYLLDVVTSASPDIVSMASRRFREQRHAGTLSGGYKIDNIGLNASSHVSREPDYLSMGGGGAVTAELNDKLITPRLGYDFSYDRIGIRNTPFAQFERNLATHGIDAGVTFVMSPTTLLVTGLTLQFERGEQSKLYRFVPMFSEDIAPAVRPGEPIDSVNGARLNIRPREQLPKTRDRFAVGARINHRFPNGTLRVEERIYTDSWGIKASTSDGRYLHDLGERLRVWPHLRIHAQSGTSFYQMAYAARLDDDGQPLVIPRYRTGDREMSPMLSLTVGGGSRIALTSDKAETQFAIVVEGEVMYSRYFRSLFITARTAVYGTIGFEAEF